MKISINTHITSVERLYNDNLITDKEYENIMKRIIAEKVKDKTGGQNG